MMDAGDKILSKETIVQLQNISKKFGGVYALNSVNFDLSNEIHSIVGHNGAGKSTLVKILMGALTPDEGKIILKGKEVQFSSPRSAQSNGIAMVWQELAGFPNISVTENLMMQRFIRKSSGLIDWKSNYEQTDEYLKRLDLHIDPKLPMGKLPLAQQQLVEFAKALSYNPSVLILDEPTSALSFSEQSVLYDKVRVIREQGVAIVYISHKLEEVMMLSDRITVLRDGHKIFTTDAANLSKDDLIEGIIGQKPSTDRSISLSTGIVERPPVLEVKSLNKNRLLYDVSFKLGQGEVLGITGLSGSGTTEIGKVLFGLDQHYTGQIKLNDKPVSFSDPQDAIANGIGYVSNNRKEDGLIPNLSVGDNIVITSLKDMASGGVIRKHLINKRIDPIMDQIELRPRNPQLLISSLSGGNQQKVIIGRWMRDGTNVLILDEPTRGVDVGAIDKIYDTIRHLATSGLSVIVLSSEFEEVFPKVDRMLVMNRGHLVGELDPSKTHWETAFEMASHYENKEETAK